MGNMGDAMHGDSTPRGRQRVGRVRLNPRPSQSDPRTPRPAPSLDPHLTLPSHPAIRAVSPRRGNTGSGRSFVSRISQRLVPQRQHQTDESDPSWASYAVPDDPTALARTTWADWDEPDDSGSRAREQTIARPLNARHSQPQSGHQHALVPARPIRPQSAPPAGTSVVAAYPAPRLLARTPAYTRAALKKARSPWAITRTVCVLCAITLALVISISATGDLGFTPPTFKASASTGAVRQVAADVQPITQLLACDEYDSNAQCQLFGNAACSAAAVTEIFNAWGVPGITIGRVIDEFGNDISAYGGLLTHAGFERVAAKHGFRAIEYKNLTYNQMLYITNTMGVPLIVDVRISYGYYRFLAGGHFLVMTGGDQNGVSIVDSSTYYIHYLPKNIFYSMFTNQATLLVPLNFQYTLPSN